MCAQKEALKTVCLPAALVTCVKNASPRASTNYMYSRVKEFTGNMRKTFTCRYDQGWDRYVLR